MKGIFCRRSSWKTSFWSGMPRFHASEHWDTIYISTFEGYSRDTSSPAQCSVVVRCRSLYCLPKYLFQSLNYLLLRKSEGKSTTSQEISNLVTRKSQAVLRH